MAQADRAREQVLRTALRLDESVQVRTGAEAWGDLRSYRAVVLDGAQLILKSAVAELHAFVENGGALLAIGAAPGTAADPLAALLGVVAEPARPQCELFAKCSRDNNELLQRIEAEFAVVEALAVLQLLHAEVRVLLQVNWGLKDEPAAVERRIGVGRIVTSSLGSNSQALLAPALGAILRRALRLPMDAGSNAISPPQLWATDRPAEWALFTAAGLPARPGCSWQQCAIFQTVGGLLPSQIFPVSPATLIPKTWPAIPPFN